MASKLFNINKEVPSYDPIRDQDSSEASFPEDEAFLKTPEALSRRRSKPFLRWTTVLASIAIIAVYTVLVIISTYSFATSQRKHGTRFLYSPANDYVTYESHVMEQFEEEMFEKPYFGEPSSEVDAAWHDLFEHQNIGFTEEYIQQLGRKEEAIQLPDGTYFGSLMVFHHLHCLKNIYHALHPDYYALDKLKGHEKDMFWEHTDHCLHMLKEAVMCQGDTTVLTMKWADYGARPIGNLSNPHECVNWDRLMEWVVPHSVNVFEDDVLVHPEFGPLFVDGKPSKGFTDSLGATGKVNGIDEAQTRAFSR